jgi:hypothetical protein
MSNSFQCTARRCADISGVGPQADVTLYNLQDRLFFNGVPLSFILTCQPGYVCPPGLFPRVVTYPPGTFVIPFPPTGGFPIVLQLQGCESLVTRTLDADATADEIAAAANEIILEVAAQEAVCESESLSSPEPTAIEMTDAPAFLCDDTAAEFSISANTTGPVTFLLFEGSLPTGMVMSSDVGGTSFTISGTPTTMGTYVFTVYAMKSGSFGSKTFSVIVGGITTASPLPNATIDSEYTEVLASNLTGTLSWSVIGGATELPSWMSLNETTGTLFGTPLAGSEGTFNFTISVTNGTNSCEKEFEIEVAAASECPDWTLIPWDNPQENAGTGATASFTPQFSNSDSFVSAVGVTDISGGATSANDGDITYNGPGCNCNLHLDVVRSGASALGSIVISSSHGLFFFVQANVDYPTTGSYDFPFSVGDTMGAPATITVTVNNQMNGSAVAEDNSISGQITNV